MSITVVANNNIVLTGHCRRVLWALNSLKVLKYTSSAILFENPFISQAVLHIQDTIT